jgi:hypothetical protein
MAGLRDSCQNWLSELMILALVGQYFDENELVSLFDFRLNIFSTAGHYPGWVRSREKMVEIL